MFIWSPPPRYPVTLSACRMLKSHALRKMCCFHIGFDGWSEFDHPANPRTSVNKKTLCCSWLCLFEAKQHVFPMLTLVSMCLGTWLQICETCGNTQSNKELSDEFRNCQKVCCFLEFYVGFPSAVFCVPLYPSKNKFARVFCFLLVSASKKNNTGVC